MLLLYLITAGTAVYTYQVFDSNVFSKQFNSKLKDLINETEQTKSFILQSLFLLSYFRFEVYLREIYNFAKEYILELPELTEKSILNQVEENLRLKELNGLSLLDFDTLDYIRLRRNAFVHRDEERVFQGTIADLIKEKGEKLNKYWKLKDLEVQSLDFTKKQIENLDSLEVIDILNIIRRLAEQIDRFIIERIGQDNLQKYLIREFEKAYQPIESWSDKEKLMKKLKHYARIVLGATMKDEEIVVILEK